MTTVEALVAQTSKTVITSIFKIVSLLVLAGVLGLVLFISLLPKLSLCGSSGLGCALVIVALLMLALVIPFVLVWGARGYVLYKVLYEVFKLYEDPLVLRCAQQICQHRSAVLAAGELSHSRLSTKVPMPVRLLVRRLDLNPILEQLKQNPSVEPETLIKPLKARIEAQGIVQKPSLSWYWYSLVFMLLIAVSVWWWL